MDIFSIHKEQTNIAIGEHEEKPHNLTLVEALSDLLSSILIYHKIVSSNEEKEYAKKTIWYLVNKWLNTLAPIKYIPGLVEEVSRNINKKLWDQDVVDIELLKELLITTYILQKSSEDAYSSYELSRYSSLIRGLLDKLGYMGGSLLIEDILDSNNPRDLAALASTIIVLSTNY